ncbi:MAG: GNAT family N-acetyltransferase [Pseudobdellovibrionaceae bacterium]
MITISSSGNLDVYLKRFIFEGLDSYAEEMTGSTAEMDQFSVSAHWGEELVGGLIGVIFWGSLQIDQIFVSPKFRSQGVGKALMEEALAIAREKGCAFCTVETMEFQAAEFYQQIGFKIEFKRTGYRDRHTLYFFRMDL